LTLVWCAEVLKEMAFQCVLMDDPVVPAMDKRTTARTSRTGSRSTALRPNTNEPFESKALFPNIDKRWHIKAWRDQHGLPALSSDIPGKLKPKAAAAATAMPGVVLGL
jgi:hypothetical protein